MDTCGVNPSVCSGTSGRTSPIAVRMVSRTNRTGSAGWLAGRLDGNEDRFGVDHRGVQGYVEDRHLSEPPGRSIGDLADSLHFDFADESDALHGQVQPGVRDQVESIERGEHVAVGGGESVHIGLFVEGQVPCVEGLFLAPTGPPLPVIAHLRGLSGHGPEFCQAGPVPRESASQRGAECWHQSVSGARITQRRSRTIESYTGASSHGCDCPTVRYPHFE